MTPASHQPLAHWTLVAALCAAGAALWIVLLACIGPWWCLGLAVFGAIAVIQLWRIAARPLWSGGARR